MRSSLNVRLTGRLRIVLAGLRFIPMPHLFDYAHNMRIINAAPASITDRIQTQGPNADRPDLLQPQRSLLPSELAFVPRLVLGFNTI
jgi:hypothetical protein